MTNRIISSLFCVCIGSLLIAIPHLVFPVCSSELHIAGSDMTVPMKCFWTARAELGVGVAVIVSGIMLFLFKCGGIRLGISLVTAALAALGFALPTWLIGVCGSEAMLCRIGALPALQLASGLLFIGMLLNALQLAKAKRKARA